MTECELCHKEIKESEFQRHLIEEHKILFTQYIGLISSRIDILKFK